MKRFAVFIVVSLLVVVGLVLAQPAKANWPPRLHAVEVDMTGLNWYINDLVNKGVPMANLQIVTKQAVDGGYYKLYWVE
jgi:hypothetical protein